MKKTLVFVFIGTVLLFASCKSKKVITEGERAKSTSHLVTLIQQAQPEFRSMNATVKVNVDMNGQTYSSPASIKIITDSVVVLAVYPFLGMEMFSLELYPDRWVLYDKMNLKYVTDNYQFFSYRYGININFSDLQSIFSARLFAIGAGEVDYRNYQFVSLEGNRNELIYDTQQVMQTIRTNNINTIEGVFLQSKTQNYLLDVNYNDYVVAKGVNFPQNIRINSSVDDTANINLDMTVQKISFNTDVKLSIARSDRYTRTTIDQIFTK